MDLKWKRADLTAWGETVEFPEGLYRKTWVFTEHAKNEDGIWFYLTGPDGREQGPFETEEEIDDLLISLLPVDPTVA
ncbi:hypothetical protein [Pseudosulfitobacter pseudonitzschiae]|uniref:hypothetical protein n=1 Tax=Pseudosulfitobacter pseudonitzschiae TaxID=1402135 RepID=UPI003B7DDA91